MIGNAIDDLHRLRAALAHVQDDVARGKDGQFSEALASFADLTESDLDELASWQQKFGQAVRRFVASVQTAEQRRWFYGHPRNLLRRVGLYEFIHFTDAKVKMVMDFVRQRAEAANDGDLGEEGALGCFLCVAICLFAFLMFAVLGVAVTIFVAGPAGVVIAILLEVSVDIVLAAITPQLGMAAFTVATFVCHQLGFCV